MNVIAAIATTMNNKNTWCRSDIEGKGYVSMHHCHESIPVILQSNARVYCMPLASHLVFFTCLVARPSSTDNSKKTITILSDAT